MSRLLNVGPSQMVPLDQVKPHPRNANQADLGAIIESVGENGFYGSLIVQSSTGYVLAGNHRLQAAKHAGMQEVPVQYIDVDDQTALRIMVADNRTTRLGTDNEVVLAGILKELAEQDMLRGSGFDGDDLDDLLRTIDSDGEDHAYGREKVECPECGHQFVPNTP